MTKKEIKINKNFLNIRLKFDISFDSDETGQQTNDTTQDEFRNNENAI